MRRSAGERRRAQESSAGRGAHLPLRSTLPARRLPAASRAVQQQLGLQAASDAGLAVRRPLGWVEHCVVRATRAHVVEVPATQKHGWQRGQVMCESAHAARVPEFECGGARAYQLGRPQDPSVRALAPLDLGALHLPVCWNPNFSGILLFGRRFRMRPRAQLGIAAARSLATG